MKSLVIGATGYVGRRLLAGARGASEALGTSSRQRETMLRLDLARPEEFDFSAIASGDAVFFAAAISSPDYCATHYEQAYAVNVTGTGRVIERCLANGARVIFFSSDTVYGGSGEPADDTAACDPAGEYAQMKHEIERRFFANPSFKSLRLSYVFSSGDKFTQYLIGCAQAGSTAQVFHPFYRAAVHLDDVVGAALGLASNWGAVPGGTVNVGGPQLLTRTELAEIVRQAAAPALRYTMVPAPPGFFVNRPAVIDMRSPQLAALLGRPARTIAEAARVEFADVR